MSWPQFPVATQKDASRLSRTNSTHEHGAIVGSLAGRIRAVLLHGQRRIITGEGCLSLSRLLVDDQRSGPRSVSSCPRLLAYGLGGG